MNNRLIFASVTFEGSCRLFKEKSSWKKFGWLMLFCQSFVDQASLSIYVRDRRIARGAETKKIKKVQV